VKGPIDKPQLAAHATGSGVRYNDVLLGDADLDLRYDGVRSVLDVRPRRLHDSGGRLALSGTVAFPIAARSRVRHRRRLERLSRATRDRRDELDMKIGAGLATER
jgi:autotransporter translocation and assembly factor TamB